jgi:hypothetical protein
MDEKTGSPNLVDFATARFIQYIPDCGISGKVLLRTAEAAEMDHRLVAVRAKNNMASVGS